MRLLLVLPILAAVLTGFRAMAQDDPNETPLGDVARNLRKKNPPTEHVIDDDNLPQVMEQAETRRKPDLGLKFLMTGEDKGFRVSTPDVTCSLAFTANAKSLLSGQYSQMNLPPQEVAKLEGPATIEGDALTVSVFNGTNWHVSEISVALTVIKGSRAERDKDASPLLGDAFAESDVRPEKKSDVTVIYRMRMGVTPWARAVFSAPLNLELTPGEEWHWAIVEAKGYPPESLAAQSMPPRNNTSPPSASAITPTQRGVSLPLPPQ